jgi:hypothetical protein
VSAGTAETIDGASGGNMKINVMLFVLVSSMLLTSSHAATKTGGQPATVVSVESHETQSNSNGASPLDLPLQAEIHSYDIGIRVGSTIYRTSYESALDYLPAIFATNHPIQVNLRKHVMYVTLPGEGAVRMAIESSSGVQDASRLAGN